MQAQKVNRGTNPSDRRYTVESIDKDSEDFGKQKELLSIDAKESVATGRYMFVGTVPRGAPASSLKAGDQIDKDGDPVAPPVSKTGQVGPVPVTPEEIAPEAIPDATNLEGLNTEELSKIIDDEGLSIEGFADLNLVERQVAVKNALDSKG